jgi:hypothetical protein
MRHVLWYHRGAESRREAEANDEGSMRPDDNLIISHLDDEWRTASAVRIDC